MMVWQLAGLKRRLEESVGQRQELVAQLSEAATRRGELASEVGCEEETNVIDTLKEVAGCEDERGGGAELMRDDKRLAHEEKKVL